ncbi:MAG: 16S rRNA (uracil(1498)-N(3))-methyltransferase [Pyrinomonadaceae bacterium]
MTRRRFFASPFDINLSARTIILSTEETRHLRDVLRLKVGEEIFVFDGNGKEYSCRINAASRDSALVEIQNEVTPASPESDLNLDLAIALLKGDKFDLVIQKATELGVTKFIPVVTRNADVKFRNAVDLNNRVGRWQRIALEASKQSGRALVPSVTPPVDINSVLSGLYETDGKRLRLMFSERDGGSLENALETSAATRDVTILIGSEGGWRDEEIAKGRAENWQIITLGGRILRAETAAVAVTALIQHICGDLR